MVGLVHRLGPGLLFAASAVGVSHLVQSTRAGAEFGLTMAALIIVACLVKYPAFRFGAEYAAATGESVISGYAREGRWLLIFFLVAIAVEGLAVIPAVSLVAAGMTMNLLGFGGSEVLVTMTIVALSSVGLVLGRYRLLENVNKVLVVLFAVLTVVATVACLDLLGGGRALSAPLAPTRDNLFFSVAVAGWMPVGMGGAVFISLWVCAKAELQARPVTITEARFDFNLGYAATVVLALCFLVMGTALLFGRGAQLASNSAGFAAELIALFTASVGAWIEPVIGIAALAVMFSTVLTVIDGFPRVYASVTSRLFGSGPGPGPNSGSASGFGSSSGRAEARLYIGFMVVQALVAWCLLGYFLSSFGVFIDFATTAGFLTAPVVAFLNHRIISSAAVAAEHRPSRRLRLWSASGVTVLTAASLVYLYFRFV